MKIQRTIIALSAGIMLAAITGCGTVNRIPEIRHAAVTPPQLQPGQVAVITVEINDVHGVVDRVEGAIPDYPDRTFKLRDDGEKPDQVAADGVWTMEVAVPFTASPGEYSITFSALDEYGRVIVVPDEEGHGTNLDANVSVRIFIPEGAAPAE